MNVKKIQITIFKIQFYSKIFQFFAKNKKNNSIGLVEHNKTTVQSFRKLTRKKRVLRKKYKFISSKNSKTA